MKMLVSVNISKGFSVWLEMAKSLNPEMEKVGVKMVWSGTNPDESKVFMIVDMKDPSQMKTFGEREDVAKCRCRCRCRCGQHNNNFSNWRRLSSFGPSYYFDNM